MQVREFVEAFMPIAMKLEREKNIPALFVLAQWAHESGWNGSTLSQKAHNMGGVKYADWMAPYGAKPISMATWEFTEANKVSADFAAFDGYEGYAAMYGDLLNFPRYKPAQAFLHDVRMFATKIEEGGYATDPTYVDKIMAVVDTLKPHYDDVKASQAASALDDMDSVPAWGKEAVGRFLFHGLLKGSGEGKLDLARPISRLEAVVILHRCMKFLLGMVGRLNDYMG